MGVIGMNLTDGDEVVGMQMESQGDSLMIVSEKGLGKCTLISEFTTQNRGGKGVKCYKITEKTGNIVGVKAVNHDNEIMLNTCKDENKNKIIKSSELIEIIEARIEEMFKLINDDITAHGVKQRINNVVLTGQGIVNISKSDVAGKVILNIPVKISTGRMVSTIRPGYRTAYALVRYVASRQFAKNVSSSIDTHSEKSIVKVILEKIKDFFYS